MKNAIFLDFDSTISHSVKAFCSTYNIIYKNHPNFKPADYTKNISWNFTIECPLINNPLDIFSNSIFFNGLEFMPNAEEVIKELNNKYKIIICSLGCYDNISLKSQWIKNNMPYIKDAILLTNQGIKMDKGIIQMGYEDSIFIDDVESNLRSSNCPRPILFGSKFLWNEKWISEGLEWCKDWLEVGGRLL